MLLMLLKNKYSCMNLQLNNIKLLNLILMFLYRSFNKVLKIFYKFLGAKYIKYFLKKIG